MLLREAAGVSKAGTNLLRVLEHVRWELFHVGGASCDLQPN